MSMKRPMLYIALRAIGIAGVVYAFTDSLAFACAFASFDVLTLTYFVCSLAEEANRER